MAPPSGTLRVGRYFLALLALFAVLYLVVFFPGNKHTPKLGIDLAGGIRVEYKAQVPKGLPAPNSSQMDQARQILEDRINGKGVSGATVVVQGSDQLVVEIPSATKTDIQQLGKASILNFRGLIAQVVPVAPACSLTPPKTSTKTSTKSTSPSTTPSSGAQTGTASSSPANSGTSGSTSPKPSASTSSSAKAGNALHERPLQAPSSGSSSSAAKPATSTTPAPSGSSKAPATPTGTAKATPTPTASAAPVVCTSTPFASIVKADPKLRLLLEPTAKQVGLNAESCPSPAMPTGPDGKTTATCNAFSKLTAAQQQQVTAALSTFDCRKASNEADLRYNYYIACGTIQNTSVAYLMGHVVVAGQQIDSADLVAPSSSGQTVTSDYSVNLTLTGSGADRWNSWTTKYNTSGNQDVSTPVDTGTGTAACSSTATYPCSDFVGFTLDGQVISAPATNAVLSDKTNITGGFNESQARTLTQQLNYGKLPVSFSLQQYSNVSATLGSAQLSAAFLAGGIGLILVVVYSLLYYRGLGLVTIASLAVSAGLTYAMLVILGKQIGFSLDLAGVAGFIVALGITADSFVVFFERIKDEVHEGRSVRVAVPRAWVRARRTILSADTVSFLAAAILYFFASADVRGFAFTLGLSTILDLVVVFLFTHPIVSLLSRSRTFGSPRFTGLNAVRGTPIADEAPAGAPRGGRPKRAASSRPAASVTVAGSDTEVENDTEDAVGDADTSGADRPTGRSAPAGGTAAERAAARRAKLRKDSDGPQDPHTEGGA